MEQEFRHDLIAHDFPRVVNIVDEHVQRGNALLEAAFDHVPFAGFDHPRHDVERPDFFGARFVAVHRERNAQVHQRPLGVALTAQEFAFGQRFDASHQAFAPRARSAIDIEHFIVKPIGGIGGKSHDLKAPSRRVKCGQTTA